MKFFKTKYKNIKIIFSFFIIATLTTYFSFCSAATNNENIKDKLYSNNNILMDAESGNILFEKNGYSKVYPASTTKILTCILALENLDLNEKVVASKKAINSIPIGSSVMGIKPEEIFSVENLLYGLMLPSRK